MRSSRTITLFSERPDLSRRSSSFAVSIVVHLALCVVVLGILRPPVLNNRVLTARYDMRHLDLNTPNEEMRRAAASALKQPGPRNAAHKPSPGGNPNREVAILRQTVQALKRQQTLVQPKVQSDLKLAQEIPVPTIVIWQPEKTPPKAIVPPPPATPMAAAVLPRFEAPNRESRLADVRISATGLSKQKMPVLPSTTSPVVVHGPDLPQKVPQTTSVSSAQPTPTAVLSLSDLRMTTGRVILPPANTSGASDSPGALTQGQGKDTSQQGNSNAAGKTGGSGAGQAAGVSKDQPASSGGAGERSGGGAGAGPAQKADAGSGSGSGSGDRPSTAHITLAKDGQFGSVVVGASLEDKYPETAGLWSGRMAYTVYLHLGLAKSWIFQYSAPRSANAEEAGTNARLDAPWPFNIVRPNLDPGEWNADALMVHGFVNQAGRFEALAMVFPPDFPQAKFVLDALAQWQFRPATQNGQNVKVEVLLIIPAEDE
ncbi:MAG: hypothetical protein ABSC88_01455 [Terracidiphilus sp.]|jgi:hypothetical protein